MAQKRYKLIIWFYLKNHHQYKTIHAASEECEYLSEEAKEAFEVAGIPFEANH